LCLQLLAQILDKPQIAECLDTTDSLAIGILENGRRYTDRNAVASRVENVDGLVNQRPSGRQGLPQRAGRLADACPKHLATTPSNRLLASDARDSLGRPIERGDPPLLIDGEHAVVDRVENDGISI